jgi:hypothetical protein
MFYVTELQERTAVYVIGARIDIAKKHATGGSNRSREGNTQNKNI